MTSPEQAPPILTVSQLTQAIKLQLEANFPSVSLQGEISNCKLQSSGHLYFSLKDSNAQIGAVMFRGDMAGMKMIPKDGDHVIIRAELNVYPPSGRYQLIVRELRQVGLGELLLRLEELKIKLHKKGWFRAEHKKPLPKNPRRIGVVTSPTGAVLHDILHILSRRAGGFHLILNPVKVQGEGAAQEIAQAIKQFNDYDLVDVMIVGRGGGSIEDLWAFNEEIVADAIFHSRIPIISAVGHETDHCIADYVADVRAPTPSAAAELVMADKAHQLNQLRHLQHRISQTLQHTIRHRKQQLTGFLKQPIFQSPYALLGPWMQRMDMLRHDMDDCIHDNLAHKRLLLESHKRHLQALNPISQIAHSRQKLLQWEKALQSTIIIRMQNAKKLLKQKNDRLVQTWTTQRESYQRLFNPILKQRQLDLSLQRLLNQHKERLINITNSLHSIDPKNLLTKGYCILFAEKDGSVITSIGEVKQKQTIRARLADGEIISTVKEVIPSDHATKQESRDETRSQL